MENRRTFLSLAAALLPAALDAQTAAPAPAGRSELARHTLAGPLEGFDVVLFQLNLAPGAASAPAHRHTGPVLGYVLEGQVRFSLDRAPDQIVATGGTFFEPTGALHSTFASASPTAPARVLAFLVVPKGSSGSGPA